MIQVNISPFNNSFRLVNLTDTSVKKVRNNEEIRGTASISRYKEMKLLIGIDSSDSSNQVIDEAASMPLPQGSEIMVISALDFLDPLPVDLIEHVVAESERLVHHAVDKLREAHPDATVTGSVPDGFAADEILRTSQEWKPDLVMVGTRGRSGLTYLILGSVSRRILLEACCAVRVVRKKERAGNKEDYRVIIAMDDKDNADKLVEHVLSSNWPVNTTFKCINVVPEKPGPLLTHLGAEAMKSMKLHYDAMVAQRTSWLDAAEVKLNDRFGNKSAHAEMLRGDAKTELIEKAKEWEADLVILGSHGRRGIDKLILGSVSEAVAVHSMSSVEVVPQKQKVKEKKVHYIV